MGRLSYTSKHDNYGHDRFKRRFEFASGGKMVIKKKLSLGLGFLFFIIFVLAIFCSYYIGKLSQEASNILKDNYNSLVYSKNMISSLEDLRTAVSSIIFSQTEKKKTPDYFGQLFEKGRVEFEKNLSAENKNITEIHESVYVEAINKNSDMFLKLCQQIIAGSGNNVLYFNEFQPAFEQLKKSIDNIHDINMQAVVRKSQTTKRDAERTISYMAAIGAFCLILAFAYFWYFPVYIANSISYLAEKMKQLLKKMDITLDVKTEDELFVILQAINLIENKHFGENKNINQVET
jgi:NtrC-family two-component system sensor histidine kinase KinB